MRKKQHSHASAADLSDIRIGNVDWCKCGYCKKEAREIIAFVVERWMLEQMKNLKVFLLNVFT